MLCGRALAQNRDVVCSGGDGRFEADSPTGVSVKVSAAKIGGMSARACAASLSWNKQVITIAANAAQIDVDAFAVDMGLGVPVAAFQVKDSSTQCCMEYQLYSLDKPARLLRTIRGGDFFRAADTDLDGRIEIWTTDAAAVNGFEKLDLSELDSAPTIVLRIEHGALLDVSAEFLGHFDDEIAALRNQLDPKDLQDFKNQAATSAANGSLTADQLHRLRQVKIKVLEIVWNYLYSGREPQAWSSLAEMWPDSDFARIRAAIVEARSHGILAQVAGHSSDRAGKKRRQVKIFDAVTPTSGGKPEVTPPEPIVLRRPPLPENQSQAPSSSELLVELVIDSAGKVRSAKPTGRAKIDDSLLQATTGWKFIPAFDGGRPVASRARIGISLMQ